jgi:hypothetical protein
VSITKDLDHEVVAVYHIIFLRAHLTDGSLYDFIILNATVRRISPERTLAVSRTFSIAQCEDGLPMENKRSRAAQLT